MCLRILLRLWLDLVKDIQKLGIQTFETKMFKYISKKDVVPNKVGIEIILNNTKICDFMEIEFVLNYLV